MTSRVDHADRNLLEKPDILAAYAKSFEVTLHYRGQAPKYRGAGAHR